MSIITTSSKHNNAQHSAGWGRTVISHLWRRKTCCFLSAFLREEKLMEREYRVLENVRVRFVPGVLKTSSSGFHYSGSEPLRSSLRKQPTFREVATWAFAKRRLRNERRNSILMTCYYPDLGKCFWVVFQPTNEMFASYNRRHEVSPSPTAHLNASNSAKHEVILKLQITL